MHCIFFPASLKHRWLLRPVPTISKDCTLMWVLLHSLPSQHPQTSNPLPSETLKVPRKSSFQYLLLLIPGTPYKIFCWTYCYGLIESHHLYLTFLMRLGAFPWTVNSIGNALCTGGNCTFCLFWCFNICKKYSWTYLSETANSQRGQRT